MKALLVIVASIFLLPAVETDYKKIFGDRYTWAVNWLSQNDALIQEYATAFNIPQKELKSIVFPELIRYNSLLNTVEIESLKYLYVKEGKEYADFSVGYFQMKPSFGEMVESDARLLLPQTYLVESGWSAQQTDDEEGRRARVKRLANVRQQLIYLCAFYKLCENRFRGQTFGFPEERVKLFATCYNAGYKRSYNSLLSFLNKKQFYSYNYASVSAYYFKQE